MITEDKDSERFSIPVAAESSMPPCGWCWWGASIVLGAESAAIMSICWVLGSGFWVLSRWEIARALLLFYLDGGLQWMALVVERGTELRCIGDAKGTGIQGRRLGAAAGHLQRRVTNKSGPHTIQIWGQLSDGDGSATTVIAE